MDHHFPDYETQHLAQQYHPDHRPQYTYQAQQLPPQKSVNDIPSMLLEQGLMGIGLLVMGLAIWTLFKRLEKTQETTKKELMDLVKESQKVLLTFTSQIGEMKTSIVQKLTEIETRLDQTEKEVERLQTMWETDHARK